MKYSASFWMLAVTLFPFKLFTFLFKYKQRHHFANKGPYSQSCGFPVVMCTCENWTIKKAEHQRTDAFKPWCWRSLLRVPWTARRSSQSILKEIEYSLEGLMLKLQILWPHHVKSQLFRKDQVRRRRG